jgi:hypothetical protein
MGGTGASSDLFFGTGNCCAAHGEFTARNSAATANDWTTCVRIQRNVLTRFGEAGILGLRFNDVVYSR